MPGDWQFAPGPWLALACAGVAYVAGVRSLRRRSRPWRPWRTVAFGAGLLTIGAALASPLATRDELFTVHVAQHMLLGMLGPLLLALSAPVTLALRTLPRAARRTVVSALHARAVTVLSHPATATALFVGGLLGLYFTPLYDQTLRHALLHELVHLHFVAAGCLFAWTFIGVDPVPRRGSFALRIGLLLAFFGQWYVAGGRRLEHERREPGGYVSQGRAVSASDRRRAADGAGYPRASIHARGSSRGRPRSHRW